MFQSKSKSAHLIVVLATALILYCGSYVLLVNPFSRAVVNPAAMDAGTMTMAEHYRLPGSVYGQIFWPLEQIDRRLRPNFWKDWPNEF